MGADIEKDLLTSATDLTAGASYSGGGTPGTTWDVTFLNATYLSTTFTVNNNLSIATLNDLDATQALTITDTGTSSRTLTLTGGADTVAGSAAADLIYLAANANLTIQNGAKPLGLALAGNGNFDTAAGATLAISSVISGSYNLSKTGSGMLTVSGTNTFGGSGKTFTLSAGTLNVNAAAALGTSGTTFVINGGTTIDNTSGAAITTGNYGVTVNGDFTFAGGGTGTAHDLSLGSGAVTLGTAAGTTRTITTAAANSTLGFGGSIANGTTANSVIKAGAGTLTFSGTGANTYTGNTTVLAGTLILSKSANTNAIAAGTLQIGDGTGGNASAVVQLGATGQVANAVAVDVRSSGKLNLNNYSDTIGALTLQSDTAQSAMVVTGTGTLTLGGNVTLNANGTGATGATFTGNLNLGNAARTFNVAQGSAMSAYDLLVSGVISSTTASSGSIVKVGAGILQFAGTAANTYTGMTTVNAGELDLNQSAGVVAVPGGLTIGDGSGGAGSDIVKLLANGQIAASSAVLINGSSGMLNLNGFTQTIGSLADTGTVTPGGSGVNLGNGTLTVGNGSNTTFSGAITGNGGNLIKQGTGALTLAGINTYTGSTTINAGTLVAGSTQAFGNNAAMIVNAGGTLDLGGNSNAVGSLTGAAGAIVMSSNGAATLTTGGLNTSTTFAGVLQNGGGTGGILSLIQAGSGTLTLTGANTFTGTTTVTAGVLSIQSSGALGTSANTANTTVASGASLQMSNGITTTNAGTLILNGAGTGSGALQNLSGSNMWNSNVTIASNATITSTAGQLTIGNASYTSLFTLGGSTVTFDGAGTIWSNSSIGASGDTGSVIKNGTGTLVFFGYTTNYTGSTTVNAGALELVVGPFSTGQYGINGPLIIGTGPSNPALAGTVKVDIWGNSYNNQISPASAVTINSDGALNLGTTPLTGSSAGNGSTGLGSLTLNGGQVNIGSGLTLTPAGGIASNANSAHQTSLISGGTLVIAAPTVFTVARDSTLTSDLTVSSVVSGGSLVKQGPGVLTLSGANTYTGGATLSGGTVIDANNTAFGTGTVTFNGGGLASDTGTRTLANTIVVNNVAGNQITGSNNLTLTGAVSGPGTLTVNMAAGTNTVTVNPGTANSFAPAMLRLNSGTLLLGGSNKIGASTAVTLAGGTLATGGYSDTMGALALNANSVLDFGTSNTVRLEFSSATWTGGTLTVTNWTGTAATSGNPDQFLITSGPVSASFLSAVNFQGFTPGALAFSVGGGMYEIVPVPEPAPIFGAGALIAFIGWRERRRLGRIVARRA